MKLKSMLCLFFCYILLIQASTASVSIYLDALDMMSHSIKNKKLSIKGSMEHRLNDEFDIGFYSSHTEVDNESPYLTSLGVYLDYNFLKNESLLGNTKRDSWFIRNSLGISYKNEKNQVSVLNCSCPSCSSMYYKYLDRLTDNGGHGTTWGKAISNINAGNEQEENYSKITNYNTESRYKPEWGIYLGRKYYFTNKVSLQIGAGISTICRISNGYSMRIDNSDFAIDSFMKMGVSI
ncbi:hypothetical protein HGB13_00325 [bacterium]|nr:hypothetical protein [bacterium]